MYKISTLHVDISKESQSVCMYWFAMYIALVSSCLVCMLNIFIANKMVEKPLMVLIALLQLLKQSVYLFAGVGIHIVVRCCRHS